MAVAQHIHKLADLLRIQYGLIERHRKIVRTQNRQIGVFAFQVLKAVTVYHGQIIFVILLRNKSSRILTKGAHLIFKKAWDIVSLDS